MLGFGQWKEVLGQGAVFQRPHEYASRHRRRLCRARVTANQCQPGSGVRRMPRLPVNCIRMFVPAAARYIPGEASVHGQASERSMTTVFRSREVAVVLGAETGVPRNQSRTLLRSLPGLLVRNLHAAGLRTDTP